MADGKRKDARHEITLTSAAAVASGEIHQMPDGRAGVYTGLNSAASGDTNVGYSTEGQFTVTKAANIVILDGGKVFWDHSANAATFKTVNDRDFFLGTAVGDAASADTTMVVNLNVQPVYLVDIARDPFHSLIVGTAAAGAFGFPKRLGGAHLIELTATSEAQKVDMLSDDGFAVGANAIVECAFNITGDGASTEADFNIGIANATHASDADSITESVFFHMDSNVVNILCESDDGTTEVAATDSTVNYALAARSEGWIDCRNPADIQMYIDGVNVLPSSVFKLDAATGPMKLLAHLEKTSSTEVYEVQVDWLRARIAEV